jgi:hypothetical protein
MSPATSDIETPRTRRHLAHRILELDGPAIVIVLAANAFGELAGCPVPHNWSRRTRTSRNSDAATPRSDGATPERKQTPTSSVPRAAAERHDRVSGPDTPYRSIYPVHIDALVRQQRPGLTDVATPRTNQLLCEISGRLPFQKPFIHEQP